jgi:hypothetical protein
VIFLSKYAALAVGVPHLGDRGHVRDVVQPPVPAPRQPEHLSLSRGDLDRCGAVVSGERIPGGEPGHVPGLVHHRGGDERADAEDLRQVGARGLHGGGQRLPRLAQLPIGPAQVLQQVGGQLLAGRLHRARRSDLGQDQVFSPPARRLQQIADQLEATGTLTTRTLVQLRQVVAVLNAGPAGTSADTAEMLAYAAVVFGKSTFGDTVEALEAAADALSSRAMAEQISELHETAETLSAAARRIERNSGEW